MPLSLRHAAWLDGWLRAHGQQAPWGYPRALTARELRDWRDGMNAARTADDEPLAGGQR